MNHLIQNLLSFIDYKGKPVLRRNLRPKFIMRPTHKNKKKKAKDFCFDNDPNIIISKNNANTAIIFIAYQGVWHESLWDEWRQQTPVHFFVHQDQESLFKTEFDFGIKITPTIQTKRGRKSHLQAILHSLDFAKKWGEDNQHIFERFYILSGDAMPIKTVYHFLDESNYNRSLSYIAYHDHETYITHNMEMILCKKHVDDICSKLLNDVDSEDENTLYNINDRIIADYEKNLQTSAHFEMMDEYVIGTFLKDIEGESFQDKVKNKVVSGWIAISSESNLQSVPIEEINKVIKCEDYEEILAPHPTDGSLHYYWKSNELNTSYIIDGIVFKYDDPWNNYLTFRKIVPYTIKSINNNKIYMKSTPVSNILYNSVMTDTYRIQEKYEYCMPFIPLAQKSLHPSETKTR